MQKICTPGRFIASQKLRFAKIQKPVELEICKNSELYTTCMFWKDENAFGNLWMSYNQRGVDGRLGDVYPVWPDRKNVKVQKQQQGARRSCCDEYMSILQPTKK